jgi:hypothetical protein
MTGKPNTAEAPKRVLNADGEPVLSIDVPPELRAEPGARETVPSGLAPLSEVVNSVLGLRPALEALTRRSRSRRGTEPPATQGDGNPLHQS